MANRNCKCGNQAEYLKRAKRWLCRDCAVARGFLVKCDGEAHSNPMIDNCMGCAPRWGWHEIANVADIAKRIAQLEAQIRKDAIWAAGNNVDPVLFAKHEARDRLKLVELRNDLEVRRVLR